MLHEVGPPVRLVAVPDQVGLVVQDVVAVHPQHVPEVLVGRADLEHLVGLLVVPLADQSADEEEVDTGQCDVHRDHRPDAEDAR